MAQDIRKVNDMETLITYFSEKLAWDIDPDDFYDIDDITYEFDAESLGLKEEAFAKITSLKQLRPLVDDQRWGIFFVDFDSAKFEVSALRKILSGLIPTRRNSAEHAVWDKSDLLFLCTWGQKNKITIGAAYFEDSLKGLPQIKMISCEPAVEDFTQINKFEQRLSRLQWPSDPSDFDKWHEEWASAFTVRYRQTIHDSQTLTTRLAEEAQGIRDRILDILEIETQNGYVHLLYEKFKQTLVHDMTELQFADMYAQTVVYGLFSARCMDNSQDDFSAVEAVDCIPNTNPFLKSLMQECLGSQNAKGKLSFDELEIGNIVELLTHTRTESIIEDFNRQTGGGREDPVIHFYEEFLNEYDKSQKVQRGVYYTPQPVVNFIVRAVDDILKTEFGVEDGLASTATKKIKVTRESYRKVDGYKKQVEVDAEVPAIQVLDPATGTGTFLRQTILQIYQNFCEARKGQSKQSIQDEWNDYVPKHLLPRLNGFELMMAPYAVAHMKLAMVLKDTGYQFDSDRRLQVYLTNSLEEPGTSDNQITLFDDPLAFESVSANAVKKDAGINVVLGNPPYSSSSSNKGAWILNLISDYKQNLNERKINLDDDYIKFIRFGQYIVNRGKNGILAYISNNSFVDGITHRVMRCELMKCFSSIYIINLHGNAKKKETAPDGSKDENVFDIQQGVSINLFVKKKGPTSGCRVFSYDLYGERTRKYELLHKSRLSDIPFVELAPIEPNYFFVPKDFSNSDSYEKGVSLTELFTVYNSGIQTKRDGLTISFDRARVETVLTDFRTTDAEELRRKYGLKADGRDWTVLGAKEDLRDNNPQIIRYLYRPFDVRYTAYTGKSRGFMGYPRDSVMAMFLHDNMGLITCRLQTTFPFQHAFVTDLISDLNSISMQTGEQSFVFPLFSYRQNMGTVEKIANINPHKAQSLIENTGLTYSCSLASAGEDYVVPDDIFYYVYACLYSQNYRDKYRENLKIDFPRLPKAQDKEQFLFLCKKGRQLCELHMMRCEPMGLSANIVVNGQDYTVIKPEYKNGGVFINKTTQFIGVDEQLWNMYIGGYQPLQKWLKERKNMTLSDIDCKHFALMVSALAETKHIMVEIDNVCEF